MLVWFSECTMLVMSEVREFLQIGSLREKKKIDFIMKYNQTLKRVQFISLKGQCICHSGL